MQLTSWQTGTDVTLVARLPKFLVSCCMRTISISILMLSGLVPRQASLPLALGNIVLQHSLEGCPDQADHIGFEVQPASIALAAYHLSRIQAHVNPHVRMSDSYLCLQSLRILDNACDARLNEPDKALNLWTALEKCAKHLYKLSPVQAAAGRIAVSCCLLLCTVLRGDLSE